jgi:hypothetical protein
LKVVVQKPFVDKGKLGIGGMLFSCLLMNVLP